MVELENNIHDKALSCNADQSIIKESRNIIDEEYF